MINLVDYIIIGHDNPDVDSILSGILLEKIFKKKGLSASFIIPDETIDCDTLSILKLLSIDFITFQDSIPSNKVQYILVDHHDRVLPYKPYMIIDHHPDDDFISDNQFYINSFSSSTSCIIGKKYENLLDKDDMILILVSTLVDTASFHSKKTNPDDTNWLLSKCRDFSINIEDYYKLGLCLTDLSDKNVIFHGLKKYYYKDVSFESSYIQIQGVSDNQTFIYTSLLKLMSYVKKNNLYLFAFIVHDMDTFSSSVFNVYSDYFTYVKYDSYISRGNNVVPSIRQLIDMDDIYKKKRK